MRMAALVKGWHDSSRTRFSERCQVEGRMFSLSSCCHKPTLAKTWDVGKHTIRDIKSTGGDVEGFSYWKGLFIMLLLKGQRTD